MNKDTNTQSFILKGAQVDAMLAAKPMQGKNLLEPLKTLASEHGLPFNILEDHQTTNKAEIHISFGDLWYCLEGEVTFVYGGVLVQPLVKIKKDGTQDSNELLAEEIKGGMTVILRPGDWLWIPAGEPHQHITQGTARLMIIKIPAIKD